MYRDTKNNSFNNNKNIFFYLKKKYNKCIMSNFPDSFIREPLD